jgi:hypothetical protein
MLIVSFLLIFMVWFVLWCLTPLSTVFQLYRAIRGGEFMLLVEENGEPGEKHRPAASH